MNYWEQNRNQQGNPLIKRRIRAAHDPRLVYQFYTLQMLHIFTHKSWATLVVHHTSVGEMASKHTTRPLQRISLVRSNREGVSAMMGPTSRGYKTQVHRPSKTKSEEQGPLKLTSPVPQVSYSKPKKPNYYAKIVPFQSCGCAVVPGCHSNDVRSLWRVAST